MVKDGWFDCHCHTWNSPDSESKPEQLCGIAIEKGLGGIAFTDHCNVNYWPNVDVLSIVSKSVKDAERMQRAFTDKLTVLRGVELGNHAYNPEIARRVLDIGDYDIVVGSVHAVSYEGYDKNISKIDFSTFTDELARGYLGTYFKETLRMVSEEDIDAVAHFSFGVRYVMRESGRVIDVTEFFDTINMALKEMVRRSIALEINANNVVPRRAVEGHLIMSTDGEARELPVEKLDYEIARRYHAMGGRLITLASDAHAPERVGRGFEQIVAELKKIGFDEGCYFQNREVKFYTL